MGTLRRARLSIRARIYFRIQSYLEQWSWESDFLVFLPLTSRHLSNISYFKSDDSRHFPRLPYFEKHKQTLYLAMSHKLTVTIQMRVIWTVDNNKLLLHWTAIYLTGALFASGSRSISMKLSGRWTNRNTRSTVCFNVLAKLCWCTYTKYINSKYLNPSNYM